MGKDLPTVYKNVVGNHYERIVFKRFPDLQAFVKNTKEGDTFELDDSLSLFVIETPGHKEDHLSFGLIDKRSK